MSFLLHQLLMGTRPTIGLSEILSVGLTEVTKELDGPMLYLLVNEGPDPCNIIVHESKTVTTSDFVLYPVGSGDVSYKEVWVGSQNLKTFGKGANTLRAICGAGSAGIKITEISRQ